MAVLIPGTACEMDILGDDREEEYHTLSVTGTVVDPAGDPVSGIEAQLWVSSEYSFPWSSPSVYTDSQGHYDTGSHSLAAESCAFVRLNLQSDAHFQTERLRSCSDHVRNIVWDTERGDVEWIIGGAVLESGTTPVVGATVRFEDWDGIGATFLDADGAATLSCSTCTNYSTGTLAGSWWLRFTPPSTGRCYGLNITAVHPDGRSLNERVEVCHLLNNHDFSF